MTIIEIVTLLLQIDDNNASIASELEVARSERATHLARIAELEETVARGVAACDRCIKWVKRGWDQEKAVAEYVRRALVRNTNENIARARSQSATDLIDKTSRLEAEVGVLRAENARIAAYASYNSAADLHAAREGSIPDKKVKMPERLLLMPGPRNQVYRASNDECEDQEKSATAYVRSDLVVTREDVNREMDVVLSQIPSDSLSFTLMWKVMTAKNAALYRLFPMPEKASESAASVDAEGVTSSPDASADGVLVPLAGGGSEEPAPKVITLPVPQCGVNRYKSAGCNAEGAHVYDIQRCVRPPHDDDAHRWPT